MTRPPQQPDPSLNPNGIRLFDLVWWHGTFTEPHTGVWKGCDYAVGRVIAIDLLTGYATVQCFTEKVPQGPIQRCLDGLTPLTLDVPVPRPPEPALVYDRMETLAMRWEVLPWGTRGGAKIVQTDVRCGCPARNHRRTPSMKLLKTCPNPITLTTILHRSHDRHTIEIEFRFIVKGLEATEDEFLHPRRKPHVEHDRA